MAAASVPRPERRLDDEEMADWLPLIRLVQLLPQALDRTLREQGGLNHAHYAILISLAGALNAPKSMTEIARIAGLSRSRLSHAITALEGRGWVSRGSSCGGDGRTQTAALTEAGWDVVRHAAPAHVAQIRSLVLDPLDEGERTALRAIAAKLLPGIEAAL